MDLNQYFLHYSERDRILYAARYPEAHIYLWAGGSAASTPKNIGLDLNEYSHFEMAFVLPASKRKCERCFHKNEYEYFGFQNYLDYIDETHFLNFPKEGVISAINFFNKKTSYFFISRKLDIF